MNQMQTYRRWAGTAVVIYLLLVQTSLVAAQDITGQWEMTEEFRGRISYATLTISKNTDGSLAGKWGSNNVSIVLKNADGTLRRQSGLSDLSNVEFQDGKLTFVRTIGIWTQHSLWSYNGTLKDGKITGVFSGEQGEFAANGARKKPMCPALGQWDITSRIGERDVTGKLVISEKPDGSLDGQWVSGRGASEMSNVKFLGGKLTFARKITFNNRTFESTFEGVVKGNDLAGTSKSERNEMAATGKRFGAALIGLWELTSASETETRTSLLTVNGNLSGRYGSWNGEFPVKDLKLENNQVIFSVETGFGEYITKSDFKGTLDGATLKGQMTSPRGTREMTGKKLTDASAVAGT